MLEIGERESLREHVSGKVSQMRLIFSNSNRPTRVVPGPLDNPTTAQAVVKQDFTTQSEEFCRSLNQQDVRRKELEKETLESYQKNSATGIKSMFETQIDLLMKESKEKEKSIKNSSSSYCFALHDPSYQTSKELQDKEKQSLKNARNVLSSFSNELSKLERSVLESEKQKQKDLQQEMVTRESMQRYAQGVSLADEINASGRKLQLSDRQAALEASKINQIACHGLTLPDVVALEVKQRAEKERLEEQRAKDLLLQFNRSPDNYVDPTVALSMKNKAHEIEQAEKAAKEYASFNNVHVDLHAKVVAETQNLEKQKEREAKEILRNFNSTPSLADDMARQLTRLAHEFRTSTSEMRKSLLQFSRDPETFADAVTLTMKKNRREVMKAEKAAKQAWASHSSVLSQAEEFSMTISKSKKCSTSEKLRSHGFLPHSSPYFVPVEPTYPFRVPSTIRKTFSCKKGAQPSNVPNAPSSAPARLETPVVTSMSFYDQFLQQKKLDNQKLEEIKKETLESIKKGPSSISLKSEHTCEKAKEMVPLDEPSIEQPQEEVSAVEICRMIEEDVNAKCSETERLRRANRRMQMEVAVNAMIDYVVVKLSKLDSTQKIVETPVEHGLTVNEVEVIAPSDNEETEKMATVDDAAPLRKQTGQDGAALVRRLLSMPSAVSNIENTPEAVPIEVKKEKRSLRSVTKSIKFALKGTFKREPRKEKKKRDVESKNANEIMYQDVEDIPTPSDDIK